MTGGTGASGATARAETTVTVEDQFAGPPGCGHGGYLAGLFATGGPGAVQVTLRRPAPLDTPLRRVDSAAGAGQLWHDDTLIAEAEPAGPLELDVPGPPTVAQARASEADSPAHMNRHGVHPTCFGCSILRLPGAGLRLAAGPVEVDGVAQVAAPWQPGEAFANDNGWVDPQFVVAALDCPGAFAFIVHAESAGLLGRMVFEQYAPVAADDTHLVTGWRIATDGRKRFAGTALFAPTGELLAAAKATWFPMPSKLGAPPQ